MNSALNPDNVHKPAGAYSHTVRVPAQAQWLAIAGQIGVDPKGKLAVGIRAQANQAMRTVMACLRANSMNKRDLVKLTVFLTDPRYIEAYRAARQRVFGDDTVPASTLLIVDGLASPDMLIEVEGWAAK